MNSKQPITCLSSSSFIHFLIFILIFITSTTFSASYSGGNETDHLALLNIKSLITQRHPYEALTSWNKSLHHCDWIGVKCGKRHRRVTYLGLHLQGLEGSLSPYVGNLTFLRALYLGDNSFHGSIPEELSRLSRLRVLNLNRNKFTGVIPANLSGFSNLERLSLLSNQLVGSIPEELSSLSKLYHFSVGDNNLTNGIPPFLGNITSMEVFSGTYNPFGGSIPNTLGAWKGIQIFFLGGCNLSGTISHFFYNFSLLRLFSLANNQLIGSLPLDIVLPQLDTIQLSGNQLSGPLPPSISNCSELTRLEMNENEISGKLTVDFGKLIYLVSIFLGDNNFGSKEVDEMKFIDSLKNCSILMLVSLYRCKFQGVLPISIGNLSNQLNILDLQENQLHGILPRSIGYLVGLTKLSLRSNWFTGIIPSTIGNLQKLKVVLLDENRLSGQIPDAIGNLSMLLNLDFSFNSLEGHIPSNMANCHNLLELHLSYNTLNGKIPTQLLKLSSIAKTLDLSHNNLFGSIPTDVVELKMLTTLDLSYNKLSGNVPSFSGCDSLSTLSLRKNLFQGVIPASLNSLKGLVELDISQNNLSGQIPPFLEHLMLGSLNLSYNDFDGEVPMLGVFANVSDVCVLGNNKLCGGIVELGLPKCKETKKHRKRFTFFIIVICFASALLIAIYLAYAWFKKKKKGKMSQSLTSDRVMKVSYTQLLKATHGFSEANLIGNGGFSSVYKGILNEDGYRVVAVKVLHLQNRGAERSFMSECEAWRNIRHRNLLKIITSCSSVDYQGNDFKALVYEFMSNGSLHEWLHSDGRNINLNFIQRINILIDVAYALDYIHNHCIPTVIHGDLKPSNILLDDDMVAHVGDFGLARLLGTNSNQNNSTGIRGTIGYVAPEYGLGNEMTISGDVYSFGMLLLEVMTGKPPTDKIFNEDLSLHIFASMALPDHVTDVIDVNIINVYKEDGVFMKNKEAHVKKIEECLASTVKIGVSCTMDSPPQRMDTRTVVSELQHILCTLQNI